MSEQAVAVEARGLTERYRGMVVLSECSFQLPAHRIIALVGANGGQVHANEHRRRAAAGREPDVLSRESWC